MIVNFKKYATICLVVCSLIEIIFFFSIENILATFVLLYGWLLAKTFIINADMLKRYPVSSLMIFGLACFHYLLPIPLTLIEFKPVTYNMDIPILTFLHHLLFITVIIITHYFYRTIVKNNNFFRYYLSKTNFYNNITDRQIWITAILGVLATYYTYFIFGMWQSEVKDRTLLSYISPMFSRFIWMPIILLFPEFRNYKTKNKKANINILMLYSVSICIIGVASNVRTIIFSGFMLFIGLYFLGVLYGFYNIKKLLSPKRLVLMLISFYVITGPLLNLGYAMLLLRKDKYSISTQDLLLKTLSIYQDNEEISKMKNLSIVKKNDQYLLIKSWDENYLNNYIFNRFCNLKVSDACLYHATNVGYQNDDMKEDFKYQIFAFTPNIFLDLFGVDYEKKISVSSYSMTDYLYSLSIHNATVRGSFIIGSMPGLGLAIFGYWYLIIIIPIFIIIFIMMDSLVQIKNGKIIYSYLFFILFVTLINYFNDRHVYTVEIRFILRTYIESIISLMLTIYIIKMFEKLFFK